MQRAFTLGEKQQAFERSNCDLNAEHTLLCESRIIALDLRPLWLHKEVVCELFICVRGKHLWLLMKLTTGACGFVKLSVVVSRLMSA